MAKINPIQIQKFLKGVDYPASKNELLENARRQGADDDVYASLQKLPDHEYGKPTDVSAELGRME